MAINLQTRSDKHIRGIDVSHWQGNIDWKKVKADGIQFAIIKATEGTGHVDKNFLKNVEGAKAAGLKVGVYHYAHPDNDPVKEVDHLLKTLASIQLDLPVALDLEVNKNINKAQVTSFAVKWLQEYEKRTGLKPLFYSYPSFIKSYIGKEVAAWPLWIANYGVNTPTAHGMWDRWEIFQYSDKGSVPGIAGNVDLNVIDQTYWESLFGQKEDDGMDEIKKQVEALTKEVQELKTRVPAPKWFVDEFGSNDLGGIIQDPNFTLEGWRTLAVSLRAQKKYKVII